MELPKNYNAKETETRIYQQWIDSGFFTPENLPNKNTRDKKFSTVIAPPNITGELHMGHALEYTLQDIIVRMKRMQGYSVLWLPGTDHAGIAAQNVVEKQLAKEGLTRHKIGREKFIERMWEWKEKYGNAILEQFKRLGLSVDWSRLRFTMDPHYQEAVVTVFNHYHQKGMIYKGERVINWCVRCATSISDLEVKYETEKGSLYFLQYGPFVIATTRPETRLGDTALAVNPDDEKYKSYIGTTVELESVDSTIPADETAKKITISLPVIADESVDKDFGTGILKVTPAHDITDAEIGQRHQLKSISVIDKRGKMNSNAGQRYEGLKTLEARKKIVEDLTALGLIKEIKEYEHNVGHCDRCNSVIESLPSEQWFLKMKELAQLAQEASQQNKVHFYPERWRGPFEHWLDPQNIKDWNISRQLWWGHKIPIDGEEDVLDTWFSSALWPLATLGWPDKTASDIKGFYPTQFITSGRDILYLWIARMLFSGLEFSGKAPFSDILIHATVLNREGRRMSKSLETGINPIELIEKYGTDALRFGLASQATGLQDLKFGEDLMVMGKKFANKLWNIVRFSLLKIGDTKELEIINPHTQFSKEVDALVRNVTNALNEYKFAEAADLLYQHIWHNFADKYIEESKDKNDEATTETIIYAITTYLKLLHPFMPFLTEELWSKLPIKNKTMLLVEKWPS